MAYSPVPLATLRAELFDRLRDPRAVPILMRNAIPVIGVFVFGWSALEAVADGTGKPFDEDLFMYCEDVDLNWRLQLAGYRAVFAPPLLPDGASGPNVTATVGTMALICLLLFGMLTVVAAASRDQMGG